MSVGGVENLAGIRHPASGIRHPASGIRHPALARAAAQLLGLVLLASAVAKAVHPASAEVFAGRILNHPGAGVVAAWSSLVIEAVLGALLVLWLRPRPAILATALLLLGFGTLIAVGEALGINQSCGCFGKLLVMSPPAAILRNGLLATWAVVVWISLGREPTLPARSHTPARR